MKTGKGNQGGKEKIQETSTRLKKGRTILKKEMVRRNSMKKDEIAGWLAVLVSYRAALGESTKREQTRSAQDAKKKIKSRKRGERK